MEINERAQCRLAGKKRPQRETSVSGSAAHTLNNLAVTASGQCIQSPQHNAQHKVSLYLANTGL